MSEHEKLKEAAIYADQLGFVTPEAFEQDRGYGADEQAWLEFVALANPAKLLAMIAQISHLADQLECARGDLAQAKQIIERDSKDAERYRFIRSDTSKGRSDICIIKKDWEARMDDHLTLDKADLAIDAAIEMERN